GGTSPYGYAWSNGGTANSISSLTAGTYCVTVTDNHNCATSCCYTVTQPSAALNASCSGTNVNCFGNSNGSAAVSATGGTAPYGYAWSNGGTANSISSLTAGT